VKLTQVHGEKLGRILLRSQSEGSSDFTVLNPEYIVLVTEQGKSPMTVGKLEGPRTILRDGSEVTFIIPVAGG